MQGPQEGQFNAVLQSVSEELQNIYRGQFTNDQNRRQRNNLNQNYRGLKHQNWNDEFHGYGRGLDDREQQIHRQMPNINFQLDWGIN